MDCAAGIEVRQLLHGSGHGGRYHSRMRFAAWIAVLAIAMAPCAFGQTAGQTSGQTLPDLGGGESELASVLAHEVSHVTQRHIARMISQQQQMQMPMMVALAAAILLGRSRPDLSIGAAPRAQAAGVQTSLSYSRDFEREADRIGLQRLEEAGYDPHAMAAFFEKMQRSTRVSEDSTIPGYFRTHPVTSERIADVQNKAASMPYRQHADVLEFQLVRAKIRADGGDARDAVTSFESALREHRYASEAAARYGLATALVRSGKVPQAQAQLERIRTLGAASPMIEILDSRIKAATRDGPG